MPNKNPAGAGLLEAAGLGFEPRLLGPEPSVLPLDDPATGPHQCSPGQISSLYIGTSFFSASVSMCATTSTYGSSPEPCSFALSRPSTWSIPEELFIVISIRIGRSSPSLIATTSIAAAESEWSVTDPRKNGMRERPCSM